MNDQLAPFKKGDVVNIVVEYQDGELDEYPVTFQAATYVGMSYLENGLVVFKPWSAIERVTLVSSTCDACSQVKR